MLKKILILFFIWRIYLFVVAFFACLILPVFGNRFPYMDTVLIPTNLPPWIWGFGNFDGVHYLRIAQNGYNAQFSQAFFPLYPLLISIFNFFPKDIKIDTRIFVDPSYFLTGFILSNLFFLFALVLFYKLIKIDFNQKIAFSSLILLLVFPTSFYFGAIYTESLFLFLVVGALYFLRKNNYLAAGIFGVFASATRIFGLLLIPVFLIEIYTRFKKKELNIKDKNITKLFIGILLTPFGTLLYMLFLKLNFDNPLYFLTSQPLFGAERTVGNLIFLPQVIYRYIKIFITVPANSQLFFNAFLEFSFTAIILIYLLLFYKKIRFSYLVFTLGCLIIPTLTGTFSSMPRYSLMSFLLLPLIVQQTKSLYKILVCFFVIIGVILTSFFIRGYWIA